MIFFVLLPFLFILFDRFISISFMVSWALIAGWILPSRKALPLAFLAGLCESLLSLRHFGWPSLLMVTIAGSVGVVADHFSLRQGRWVIVSGVIGELVYRLVFGEGISWMAIGAQGIFVWVICTVYELVGKREGVYLKK